MSDPETLRTEHMPKVDSVGHERCTGCGQFYPCDARVLLDRAAAPAAPEPCPLHITYDEDCPVCRAAAPAAPEDPCQDAYNRGYARAEWEAARAAPAAPKALRHETEHWPHTDGSGRWCVVCDPIEKGKRERAAAPEALREAIEAAIADISEEWAESAEWLARMIVENMNDRALAAAPEPSGITGNARTVFTFHDGTTGPGRFDPSDGGRVVREPSGIDVERLAGLPIFRQIVDDTRTLESYEEVAAILAAAYDAETARKDAQ